MINKDYVYKLGLEFIDEYSFDDDKWVNKKKNENVFNACYIEKDFNIDEQRYFVEYLKKYNYNYVVFYPYDFKHLHKVNDIFMNESSLKHFINNLHAANIGVMFKFDTECFVDYEYGLNDCSIISIPFYKGELECGKIAIIGPRRLQYNKVIPLLEYIAKEMPRIYKK